MGEECAIMGVDDFELSLELSIGGVKYGISTSNDSSCCVDLQRRKRRLKKSRKNESLVEEKRRRRGIGEIDGFLGERIRKNEKGGGGFSINHDDDDDDDDDDLSLSLFTQNKRFKNCSRLLYPQVQSLSAHPNPSSSSSSSAVSDYQTTSQRGGSSTDTGSHSSPLQGLRPYHSQHLQSIDSSCLTEPDHHHGVAPAKLARPPPSIQSQPRWGPSPDNPKVASNTHFYQTTNNNNNACLAYPGPVKPVQMPCVTTTGNGPNGRTVRGFLYKYTNAEVSIVCVCHGSSFSPSGFVEHAGGVGISHPLKHITVVRSAFR